MIGSQIITSDRIIAQSEDNIVSDMGGEKVMLSVHNGKYYNLGQIGGQIWDMIRRPIAVSQLVAQLTSEYDVEPGQCENQVIDFLELLLGEGLIDIEKVG